MALNRHSVPLALLATVSLTSCSLEEEVQPLASASYEVPFSNEPITLAEGCWEENTSLSCPVLIQEDGSLTHRGAAIVVSEVHTIEAQMAQQGIESLLTIAAHPSADFADVVDNLFAIFPEHSPPEPSLFESAFGSPDQRRKITIDMPRYALVELEQHREAVGVPTPKLAAEFEQSGFAGSADEYALPIWAGYSPDYDACIIKIHDGESVASAELYDRAFVHLDHIVQEMGGAEYIINEPSALDRIIARVQSAGTTPWRCIAAVTYGLERAGWPEIRFEVVADDRAAAASR